MGWMFNAHHGRITPGKETRYPLYWRLGGWAPGPVSRGVENLAPTGIPSPYRATRSESPYRLSYSDPHN